MTLRNLIGKGSGGDEAWDDAIIEELITGQYEGDAPDLVAVGRLFEHVRSFANQPVPPPSAALTRALDPSHSDDRADRRMNGSRPPRALRLVTAAPSSEDAHAGRARDRSTRSLLPAMAAVAAVLVVIALVAGSAGVLPGPTQDLVAKVVRTVTPIEFPEHKRPAAAWSRARSPQTATPSHEDTGRSAAPSPPRESESGTHGTQPIGRDAPERRSDAGETRPPTPAPTTTVMTAPGPTTTVPEPKPPSDSVATSVPQAPPRGRGFVADLRGADGSGTAVLEAHPGRNELCLVLAVSDVGPVTGVHLHAGPIGVTGPIVATFPDPGVGAPARCVVVADALIKRVRNDPGAFYLDVHTPEFPNGAVRGQLRK